MAIEARGTALDTLRRRCGGVRCGRYVGGKVEAILNGTVRAAPVELLPEEAVPAVPPQGPVSKYIEASELGIEGL